MQCNGMNVTRVRAVLAGGPGPGDFFYSTTLRVAPVPRFWGPGMEDSHSIGVIGGHDTYSPTYSLRQTADALKG